MKNLIIVLFACYFSFILNAEEYNFQSSKTRTNIIEVYTSQGCSSCPPAEKWAASFIKNEDLWSKIIPLTFHVDYWDYLGWKDVYADKNFTRRQYSYNEHNLIRSVYTPGIVVNGKEWRNWFQGQTEIQNSDETPGILKANVKNGEISARFLGKNGTYDLNVALLGFNEITKIRRGENGGRTIKQEFVVLDWVRKKSSSNSWNLNLPEGNKSDSKKFGVAFWVSKPEHPYPIQATGGYLFP